MSWEGERDALVEVVHSQEVVEAGGIAGRRWGRISDFAIDRDLIDRDLEQLLQFALVRSG